MKRYTIQVTNKRLDGILAKDGDMFTKEELSLVLKEIKELKRSGEIEPREFSMKDLEAWSYFVHLHTDHTKED